MKDIVFGFFNKPFVRNVVVVATGTAGAQAITIVFAPIITRLYGPEAFGLLGTFMALVTVLTPIAALTYPIAIVLPIDDTDAKGIARLSFYTSLLVTLLVIFGFLAGGDHLLSLLDARTISPFVMLIPLNMLFAAWLQIAEQWLIRKQQFKITAKVAVVQALMVNGSTSGIGFFHPFASMLIILSTAGTAFYAVILAIIAKKTDVLPNTQKKRYQNPRISLLTLAKRYYDFPIYRTPQVLINAFSQSLPILMLTSFFGPTSAGFYLLGRKLLGLPVTLISNSVSNVLHPKIAMAAQKGENISRLIIKATLGLAAVGLLPFSSVFFFGPWLFGFIFGKEWTIAGEYARWLALWLFFQFINRPSVTAVPVLCLQKGLVLYELFSTGTKLFALYIGFIVFANDIAAVVLFSIFGTVAYIILIMWVIVSSKGRLCENT